MTEVQGSWERTTGLGQLWQDSHDSKVRAQYLGHDVGYGAGQDNTYRSVWTGQPENSLNRSGRTGQRGRDASTCLQRLGCGAREMEQVSQDRTGGQDR
jgi:hypothetical protein